MNKKFKIFIGIVVVIIDIFIIDVSLSIYYDGLNKETSSNSISSDEKKDYLANYDIANESLNKKANNSTNETLEEAVKKNSPRTTLSGESVDV